VAFIGTESEHLLGLTSLSRSQPVSKPKHHEVLQTILTQIESDLSADLSHSQLTVGANIRMVLAAFADHQPSQSRKKKKLELASLVDKSIRWIMLQYNRSDITIEQLAEALGYHRTYFSQLFKQHTGLSPRQYLMQVRLNKAKELLQEQDLTIQQVAYSVGYSDPLYFSKQFKLATGNTPVEFKKRFNSTD
jgi:AraC-like DNA-binding protein